MMMLLARTLATKTPLLASPKATLILQQTMTKMHLLLKTQAIEMLLVTILDTILKGFPAVGQKRKRQRCPHCISEVARHTQQSQYGLASKMQRSSRASETRFLRVDGGSVQGATVILASRPVIATAVT